MVGLTSRFQGVDLWKLGDLAYKEGRSLYKLALKDNWTQNSEGDGHKGVFSLVKVSWEKESGRGRGKEVVNAKSTEVTVNETNKVWLIAAKGEKAIYLMPVVRTSGWCGWVGAKSREEGVKKAKEKIESEGIKEIGGWNSSFDERKDWWKEENTKLKSLMSSGFSITRKIAVEVNGKWENRWRGAIKKKLEGWEEWDGSKEWLQFAGAGTQQKLYKNAGELTFKGKWGEEKLDCHKYEKYFPLDLVILNNSEEQVQPRITHESGGQKITITDTISEVIGVRLNQVFLL